MVTGLFRYRMPTYICSPRSAGTARVLLAVEDQDGALDLIQEANRRMGVELRVIGERIAEIAGDEVGRIGGQAHHGDIDGSGTDDSGLESIAE